ncbi:MAG: IS200/IS605 family transposase [Lentisphaeria bacterium]
MGNSYISLYIHAVFRTKNNAPFLSPSVQERMYPYFGGIAREHHMKLLEVGGIEDHVHPLLSLPPDLAVTKAMQILKGGSSKWIHTTVPSLLSFSWQEEYGAFSVGVSQISPTVSYIANQRNHHQNISFHYEFIAFLKKHNIPYDERYL